ncbi:MAG: PD-(D/E)XK nuclease-like domain-containing protein [Endomicrobiia bacterium]|nr:PD-(D/E)XK nuclease-like domain-containing protein [Endomicrobiia bacterium]
MKQGIHDNIPFADYKKINAVSASYLNRLSTCPANALIEHEDTPALAFGRAAHTLILEGEQVMDKQYFVLPDTLNNRTKEGRAEKERCLAKNAGKEPLTFDNYIALLAVQKSVQAHPAAAGLVARWKKEQTIIWKEPSTGFLCKCRPDILPEENRGTIIDLKTTRDASPVGFWRDIKKYKYDMKAAFYLDALYHVKIGRLGKNRVYDSFVFIAIEPEPPYRVECYVLDEAFIERGRNIYLKLLQLEQHCREMGAYPNYISEGVETLELNKWPGKEDV